MDITPVSNKQSTGITRTERGLVIAGTRITLYDIMDYIKGQYPPKFIGNIFNLTNEQINAAISYIEANRTEVEAEYQLVLKEAEEIRQRWEEKNRELIAWIAKQPPKPGKEAVWKKLQEHKAKRQAKSKHQTGQAVVTRTERGLALAGTRITLYDIMDYLKGQYPPKLIGYFLNLTDEQINAALSYIEVHKEEVEAEYQEALQTAKEIRQYWEERNREHFARIKAAPPTPGYEAVRAKLQEHRIRRESKINDFSS